MKSEDLMVRAINLAKKGIGHVSPNPLVGALIVKDGEVIAEGWHKKYGSHHAEVEAINNAGNIDLTGATLVVNLEPCTHYGKTPPCAPLIVEKGFSKVIIGMVDPNPEVAGKGIQILQDAGIEVELDIMKDEALWLNRTFAKFISHKLPYVIAKSGISIDGQIATRSGNSKWITSEESRRRVHALRSSVDAVLIGENTAVKDNPKLNVRHIVGRNPKRIILDTDLSLPLEMEMFKDEGRFDTIVCCSEKAAKLRKAENLKIAGVKILPVAQCEDKTLCLDDVLNQLAEKYSVSSLLVEGGAKIFSSFLKKDLIDELRIYYAPIAIGDGLRQFEHFSSYYIKDAAKFKFVDFGWSGEDIEITAVRAV